MPEHANYRTAADVFGSWRDDVLSGKPPVLYPIGTGDLARIEIGPKLVTLIGGAPGAGKTAFVMQGVTDALRLTPTLKAVVCNVEMPPEVLLDRQLARLSGIAFSEIRHRRLGALHADRIEWAMDQLESIAERLCFVRSPFDLTNVAATADAFGAGLIVLDYIQRIRPRSNHDDHRGAVNETMDYLRRFADAGGRRVGDPDRDGQCALPECCWSACAPACTELRPNLSQWGQNRPTARNGSGFGSPQRK